MAAAVPFARPEKFQKNPHRSAHRLTGAWNSCEGAYPFALGVAKITRMSRPVPRSSGGALRVVTNVERGMRWTRQLQQASEVAAYGKGVWSRYPDADIK